MWFIFGNYFRKVLAGSIKSAKFAPAKKAKQVLENNGRFEVSVGSDELNRQSKGSQSFLKVFPEKLC